MAARLPNPGQDAGLWGDILNDFLTQIHNNDGTLKDGVVAKTKLSSSVQSSLDNADAAVAGSVPDATSGTKGKLRLTGDLGGTADSPTVPGLVGKASTSHQSTHQAGGADPLSGNLDANARLAVSKAGTSVGTRRKLNLIEGTNVTITATDDNAGEKVDITINAADSGSADVGQVKALSTKTANYTLTDSDEVILADATSGAFTVTLPTAVGRTKRKFVIKRVNSGSNAVTVQAQGGQTIDGGNTASLSTQYTSVTVVSDGTNWLII